MSCTASIPDSQSDKRKFVLNFDCDLVGCGVEFKWTELASNAKAGGEVLQLEQWACSGMGLPGCPVDGNLPFAPAWQGCPRMARLEQRLHAAQPVTVAVAGQAQ